MLPTSSAMWFIPTSLACPICPPHLRCYNRRMKVYRPAPETHTLTIRRYGELADRGGDPRDAARAWTAAGFDDEETGRWLDARCFDPVSARELADLGVTAGQASKRTRDGAGESYIDTIAHKGSMKQLSARQGAARA